MGGTRKSVRRFGGWMVRSEQHRSGSRRRFQSAPKAPEPAPVGGSGMSSDGAAGSSRSNGGANGSTIGASASLPRRDDFAGAWRVICGFLCQRLLQCAFFGAFLGDQRALGSPCAPSGRDALHPTDRSSEPDRQPRHFKGRDQINRNDPARRGQQHRAGNVHRGNQVIGRDRAGQSPRRDRSRDRMPVRGEPAHRAGGSHQQSRTPAFSRTALESARTESISSRASESATGIA